MKEKLYTIPLNDAMDAHDECPFCFIERNVEHDIMDYVLGSCASYMESDTRDETDKAGFCRMHYQKMFDYGNTLGSQDVRELLLAEMLRNSTIFSQALGERNTAGLYTPLQLPDTQDAKGGTPRESRTDQ